MNGNQMYEEEYKRKIEGIISKNADKEYLQGFYYYMIGGDTSYSTAYDYINYAVNFMNCVNKQIKEITLDDYTFYLAQKKNNCASYQISVYSGLKKFATYLQASRRTSDNPMNFVSRPKFIEEQKTIEKREKGFLNTVEIKQYKKNIIAGAGSKRAVARQEYWKERDMSIILIFLITGMRCAGLYKLDVNNIDFNTKSITTIDKGGILQKHSLTDEALEYIKLWIQKRSIILGDRNENALFISNQKTRMDRSSIARVVNKYAVNIRGKNITPHKLRATYGTHLYDATKDLYFVQKAMGHSNPATTEKYIRGQNNENRIEAANIMTKIINKN